MKKSRKMIGMAASVAVILSAFGMREALASETEQHVAETKETESGLISIGEKKTDADYEVLLSNETGSEITQIALRVSYGAFSENLLGEGVSLEDGAQGQLWCSPGEIVNFVPPVYDLQLSFADNTTAVVHTLPFGDAEELHIVKDEDSGLVYMKFFSISMNTETDSRYREESILESGEKGLIADYNAKIQGGAAEGSGSASSVAASTGNGGGNGDKQCLDNGLLF